MDCENNIEKEFEPCWVLFCSYFKGDGVNTFGQISVPLNQNNFGDKPEITTHLINLTRDLLFEKCKFKNVIILNTQIIWMNEPLK